MKYYLVKSSWNWADEIDFGGSNVFTEEELEKAKYELKILVDEGDVSHNAYIGSNEDQDICPSEVLNELNRAEEITEAEYNAIRKADLGTTLYDKFNQALESEC